MSNFKEPQAKELLNLIQHYCCYINDDLTNSRLGCSDSSTISTLLRGGCNHLVASINAQNTDRFVEIDYDNNKMWKVSISTYKGVYYVDDNTRFAYRDNTNKIDKYLTTWGYEYNEILDEHCINLDVYTEQIFYSDYEGRVVENIIGKDCKRWFVTFYLDIDLSIISCFISQELTPMKGDSSTYRNNWYK